MSERSTHLSLRRRLGAAAAASALVLSLAGAVHAHASTRATTPTKTIAFSSKTWTTGLPQGYKGSFSAERQLTNLSQGQSAKEVFFSLSFFKNVTGQTTNAVAAGEAVTGFGGSGFGADWADGTLAAPINTANRNTLLNSGSLKSGTQMGTFGSASFKLTGQADVTGPKKSCGGNILTWSRKVLAKGSLDVHPDATGAPQFFGEVMLPQVAGKLSFQVVKNPNKSCSPSPQPSPCPAIFDLSYAAQTSNSIWFLDADETAPVGDPATFSYSALLFDLSNPDVFAIRLVVVTTPDATWFVPSPDDHSATIDTGKLNQPWFSGSGNYTYDGNDNQATGACGTDPSKSVQTNFTNGVMDQQLSISFDGAGTLMSPAGPDPATQNPTPFSLSSNSASARSSSHAVSALRSALRAARSGAAMQRMLRTTMHELGR